MSTAPIPFDWTKIKPKNLMPAGKLLWRLPTVAMLVVAAVALPRIANAEAVLANIDALLRTVVSVFPDWPQGRLDAEEPEGSGVVVLDGTAIVTALHVLEISSGSDVAERASSARIRTSDGLILEARVAAFDEASDLAVLVVDEPLPALAFGGDPQLGDEVCALGNAFGLGLSVTCGYVSAVHRAGVGFNAIEDFVQTDAAVNPGASGGALVTADGELVGILSAIFTKTSDANIGVNFAVSAPLAERVVLDLIAEGSVSWNFAGAGLAQYPPRGEAGELAAQIVRIRAGSAAETAGLLVEDRIVHVAGARVRSPDQFRGILARFRNGDSLEVQVRRGDTSVILTLILE